MKSNIRHAILALVAVPAMAQTQEANILSPELWPRNYKADDFEIAIYQPQILEWRDFRILKANAALALKSPGKEELTFGALVVNAETIADFEERTVSIGTRQIEEIRFPELKGKEAANAVERVRSVLTPEKPLAIPLDSMLAAVDLANASTDDTKLNLEPPPIFHSDSPAILVLVLGDPKLEPVTGDDPSLLFVRNTNWDILFDTGSSAYFLLNGNQWLTAKDLVKGPWNAASALPESFRNLPSDDNWAEVKARLTVLPGGNLPKVFVTLRPAEILITDGKPQFAPITGTALMYVANTESDLFFHGPAKTYYLLSAGRWFSSASLDGPWAAASHNLPGDFAKIPENHPKAQILVSVAGTPQADEAVIQASIPQTATVSRSTTTLSVSYDGKPQFKEIPGVKGVRYAYNTTYDVFLVGDTYYCCHQGVWFVAPSAQGEWKVCDRVPKEIYAIPPESPKYNVTHVYVYDSTPDTVVVGVTSGYSGVYVAGGLVMFGLGCWMAHEMWEDYWHPWCQPAPYWYGYGSGAYYRAGYGYCGRGGSCYGPYGGAGFATAYNPATGTYARGACAYGPYGAAGYRAAYNPWTHTGAYRSGGVTPYGSWGRSAVVRNDEWMRAAHASNWRGTVGGIQTSRGGAAIGVDRNFGSDGFVGRTGGGDVYVGHDGNIYRRTEDGWQKRSNGGWNDAGIAAEPLGKRPATTGDRPDRGVRAQPINELPGAGRPGTGDRANRGGSVQNDKDLPATRDRSPSGVAARPINALPGTDRPSTGGAGIRSDKDSNAIRDRSPGGIGARPDNDSPKHDRAGTGVDIRSASHPVSRGYENRQATTSQLNRDAYSRQRSAPSRAGSARIGGGGGRRR